MPVVDVLLVVQVFAPLYQVIHFSFELVIVQLHQPLVVKRVLIQLLKHLEVGLFACTCSDLLNSVRVLSKDLCILSIFVEFAQPFELFSSLFLLSKGSALVFVEMEFLGLVSRA